MDKRLYAELRIGEAMREFAWQWQGLRESPKKKGEINMVKIKSHKGRVVTDVRGTESEIFADMMTAIHTFFKDFQEDASSPEMYYALEKRFVALILSGHVLQGGGEKIDRIMTELSTVSGEKEKQSTIDDETVEHPIE